MKTFDSINFSKPSQCIINVIFTNGMYLKLDYDASGPMPIDEFIKSNLTAKELTEIAMIETTNTYNLF